VGPLSGSALRIKRFSGKVLAIVKKRPVTSIRLAKLVARFASDKKAEDIIVLDVRKASNFCEYFVISTGNSDRQLHAIARGIEEGLHEEGIEIRYRKGVKDIRWVLLDLGPVVAHVFSREARTFYGLEYLWQESRNVKWDV
jgi:ribosome-associated protein